MEWEGTKKERKKEKRSKGREKMMTWLTRNNKEEGKNAE